MKDRPTVKYSTLAQLHNSRYYERKCCLYSFYWSASFCGILFVSVKSCSFQFALCSPKLAHLGMHIWTWASLKAMAYFCASSVLYVHTRHWKSPLWKKINQLFFLPWREAQEKPCKGLQIMHNESSYHNPKQNVSWEMWNSPSFLSPSLTHTWTHTLSHTHKPSCKG